MDWGVQKKMKVKIYCLKGYSLLGDKESKRIR
jgi:hypothetical protein